MNPWQIRVDTGGTFTDCRAVPPDSDSPRLVKLLSSGRLRVTVSRKIDDHTLQIEIPKSWLTPDDFFTGFEAAGFGEVTEWQCVPRQITLRDSVDAVPHALELFTGEEAPVLGARLLTGTGPNHEFPPLEFRLATTRGTNALLERKGAPVTFFVTRGFGDLLKIRDQRRPDLFALQHVRPEPLYETVIEIDERLASDGTVLQPIEFPDHPPGKIAAVALLHSHINPAHEQALRDHLFAAGFEHISLSSALAPLIKVVPRAETAVVNAYLTPVMESFIENIRAALPDQTPLHLMNSAGGLEPAESFHPKDSLLSGPAGGVAGAAAEAEDLQLEQLRGQSELASRPEHGRHGQRKASSGVQIITFDMGGTSTDVARYDGDFLYRFEQNVGDARLLSPALKIETVAAGGGSICRRHPVTGEIQVGPDSAGADPGPACYGRGGPLTVTDVNLLLNRIDPANFGIPISDENIAAARAAAEKLQPGFDEDFLRGLAEVANEQMADAIRTISIRDGADPADYALLAFGGAGPLHACDIAEKLGMKTIIVPAEAGLLSAYGLHCAQIERFAERQILRPLSDREFLQNALGELEAEAIAQLPKGSGDSEISRRLAELRLQGQDATLTLEFGEDPESDFRAEYESIFGYPPAAEAVVEVVVLRVVARKKENLKPDSTLNTHSRTNRVGSPNEPGWFVNRADLATGQSIVGPCVIQDPFSTLFLRENWTAEVAETGALLLSSR
ncbi:MAG: hydantoinase/oxoprolinase family protein [Verrucomicrobiales bacterium]|nr:hydantoinase/oxoprolinase family protein [Verrucomicrobiales bacterium]